MQQSFLIILSTARFSFSNQTLKFSNLILKFHQNENRNCITLRTQHGKTLDIKNIFTRRTIYGHVNPFGTEA